MKIQNKKMIAFLMAIVMIVTFVNFGTLSAFANDDEPIENTEITLEDNTASDAEEQPVEELVSEIPELVSEPGSPDDPTENGSLGDISSGEVDFSQGDNTADLNNLDQPIIYEPVGSSYQYLPDGVYSLKNYGNTNYWASILNASDDANGYAVQTYYTDNPMDSFNRACLFKISRIPNTNRYVIRLMLNNRLGLSLVGSAVRTKELPTNDADVPASDTFVIVPNGSGYTIKPYNSDYVITAPNSTSSGTSNAKLHRYTEANAEDRCIWSFYRYIGEPLLGIPLDFSPNDWSYGATLNTEYTVELKPWSTTIGANTPYVVLHPDSVGAATEERIDAYTIKITPTKVGPITIRAQIYVDGTTTTHTSYRCDFITVPDFDEKTALIENAETNQFVEITNSSTSSGAIIQQRSFHGANNSRWKFELEWWGYFSIVSLHSNLRVGVDSSNTSLVRQTSEQTTYTDWMFTELSDGIYTIKNKAVSDKVLSIPISGGEEANLTLVTYSNNNDNNDEWIINFYKYTATVNNYYDKGYYIRYGESEAESKDKIKSYTLAVAKVYLKTMELLITTNEPQYYNSPIDQCKGQVTSSNIDLLCNHSGTCHTDRSSVINSFRSSFGGSDTVTNVLWSGHKIKSIASNGDPNYNRSCSSLYNLFIIEISDISNREMNSQSVLLHELNHQYGAPDHYHELRDKEDEDSCKFKDICSQCGENPRPSSCVMKVCRLDITGENIICYECQQDMIDHLDGHHKE